jgi:cyclic lactone autoinducer peptide
MINIAKEKSRTLSITLATFAATALYTVAHAIVGTNSIVFIYSGDTPEELMK